MARRSTRRQTCHDGSVRRRASGLRSNGWSVKADVSGFSRPPVINGSRPDIYATKGRQRRIVEVETQDTKRRDWQQHRNLRSYAKSHRNTQFMMRTCKT